MAFEREIREERLARVRAAKPVRDEPWPGATSWSYGESEKWESGPWDGEPDKVLWRDEATGLHCIARRGGIGAWCGYVAVEPGHPAHGLSSDQVHERLPDLSVHGGLTFAEGCHDTGEQDAICHPADDDKPVWWLGFDCAHSEDFVMCFVFERMIKDCSVARCLRPVGMSIDEAKRQAETTYRTIEYIKAECASLARQLKAAS